MSEVTGSIEERVEAMLENRHTWRCEWCEPWPATGPEGNDVSAHITLSATIHDCINLERSVSKAAGRPTEGKDGDRLLDFIAVHWAKVVRT